MAMVLNALFFDKLRGFVTAICLVVIAAILGANFFFPKPVRLDDDTTEVIVNAADTMRKAAASVETMAHDNAEFRQSMQQELAQQSELRKNNYASLYEQYGFDTGSPPTGIGFGLQPPPDLGRGGPVPQGQSHPGGIEQLQHPAPDRGDATVGSNPGASGGGSIAPSIKGGATGNLSGKQ